MFSPFLLFPPLPISLFHSLSFSPHIPTLSVCSKTCKSWKSVFFYPKNFGAYVIKLPLHKYSLAIKLRKFNIDIILLSNPQSVIKYDKLLQLYLIYLFLSSPGSNIRSCIIIYFHEPLVSFNLKQFLNILKIFLDINIFEEYRSVTL